MADDDVTVDLEAPEVQEAIAAKVAEAVATAGENEKAVAKKNKELLGELKGLKKAWEGLDPEETRSLWEKVNESEEAKLIADGKIDEAFGKRLATAQKEFDTQLADMNALLETERGNNSTMTERLTKLQVDGKLTEVGLKIGVTPAAMPDFLRRGRDTFKLGEDGEPVPMDGDVVLHSKTDPTKPLAMEEWGEGLKRPEGAPHFFVSVDSAGGGAGSAGNGKAGGGEKAIHREAFDSMSNADRKKFLSDGGKVFR